MRFGFSTRVFFFLVSLHLVVPFFFAFVLSVFSPWSFYLLQINTHTHTRSFYFSFNAENPNVFAKTMIHLNFSIDCCVDVWVFVHATQTLQYTHTHTHRIFAKPKKYKQKNVSSSKQMKRIWFETNRLNFESVAFFFVGNGSDDRPSIYNYYKFTTFSYFKKLKTRINAIESSTSDSTRSPTHALHCEQLFVK